MKHITKITATIRVNALINSDRKTKTELSELLGIGRTTLDRRLYLNNWKNGELEIIKSL